MVDSTFVCIFVRIKLRELITGQLLTHTFIYEHGISTSVVRYYRKYIDNSVKLDKP